MQKYGASYILLHKDDSMKAYWIFWAAGLEVNPVNIEKEGKNTIIFRLLENRETAFFILVYSDDVIKIYKVET